MSNHKREENSETISQTARDEKLSELDILQQSLEEKKKQAESYYDQLLRLKAEFENYRRRSEKEKQSHLMWGKEEILMKQIGLLDVLQQAAKSAQSCTNIESIRKGLDLITQEFVKMLCSEGVAETNPLGKKFDPSTDEAVERVASDQEEGTVVDVAQKGYTFNGRVIRPAKVKVAKKEEKK